MTRTTLFFLIGFLVFSCKNNSIDKPKKPDNLIPKDSMVEILYDLTIINSAKGVNKYILESKGVIPEDYIFKRHNIDSVQFVLSNEYYAYDLKKYEEIYNKVKAKLNNDLAHFNALAEEEEKTKDSINQLRRQELDSIKKFKDVPLIKRPKFETNDEIDRVKIVDSSQ